MLGLERKQIGKKIIQCLSGCLAHARTRVRALIHQKQLKRDVEDEWRLQKGGAERKRRNKKSGKEVSSLPQFLLLSKVDRSRLGRNGKIRA